MLGKAVIAKQRIKHGLGDEVLRQHFHNLAIADTAVQVVAQFIGKGVESVFFFVVDRVIQDGLDVVDMGAGNLGNVVGPVFPVVAVAYLLH